MQLFRIALCYDFDETLVKGNMQEKAFIPSLGMDKADFWKKVNDFVIKNKCDPVLGYMYVMLNEAQKAEVSVTREQLAKQGRSMSFFKGLDSWFERIKQLTKQKNQFIREKLQGLNLQPFELDIRHFIISSGNDELIKGSQSPIIQQFMNQNPDFGENYDQGEFIFASRFFFNHNEVATWPSLAINYTNKTQFLFRIAKGCFNLSDHKKINEVGTYLHPMNQMIYIGDGDTDVPCFRLVKHNGGHAIGVYHTQENKDKLKRFYDNGRINYYTEADYSQGSSIEQYIDRVIDKLVAEHLVKVIGGHELATKDF